MPPPALLLFIFVPDEPNPPLTLLLLNVLPPPIPPPALLLFMLVPEPPNPLATLLLLNVLPP